MYLFLLVLFCFGLINGHGKNGAGRQKGAGRRGLIKMMLLLLSLVLLLKVEPIGS